MSFDPIVELTINNKIVDVTADVTGRGDGFRIVRGQANEASRVAPSVCEFELNNAAGKYTPRNPYGPYYGKLVRNLPVRVCTRELRDDFDRTAASGWGSAPGGHVWQLTGTGGTVANANWSVANGRGAMSIPVLGAMRRAYLSDMVYRDVDISAITRIETGIFSAAGTIEMVNLILRGNDDPSYYVVAVTRNTDGNCYLSIRREGVNPATLVTPVLSGNVGQNTALSIRAQVEGDTIRAKVAAGTIEPVNWMLSVQDRTWTRGYVGIQFGASADAGIAIPAKFTVDSFEIRSPRFSGELASLPPRWDTTGQAAWVPVEAGGITRRLASNDVPINSAPRRYQMLRLTKTTPAYYWPLEEPPGSERCLEALDRMFALSVVTGAPKFGEGSLGSWLPNTLAVGAGDALQGTGSFIVGTNNPFTFHFARLGVPGSVDQIWFADTPIFFVTPTVITGFSFDGNAKTWGLTFRNTFVPYNAPVPLMPFDGQVHHYCLNMTVVSGTISYSVYIDGLLCGANAYSGPDADIVAIGMSNGAAATASAVYGHVGLTYTSRMPADRTTYYQAISGWPGELAGVRMARLCSEGFDETNAADAMPFDPVGDLTKTAKMGPQRAGTFLATLQECADVDRGVLYEPKGVQGLAYRTGQSLYNQAPALSLSYGNKELAPPWEPTDDDQTTVNDVVTSRPDGGTSHYEQKTGSLAVATIGRYRRDESVNVASDTQLPSIASWIAHVGTVDEARFPRVGVNRARPPIANNPTLSHGTLDLGIGDRLTVADVTALNVYGTISQLVLGYEERVDQYQHTFVFNCVPEAPYQVMRMNSATEGRVESANSKLAVALTKTDTILIVDVGSYQSIPGKVHAALWSTSPANLPLSIMLGGEEMLVTAITNPGTFSNSNMSFVSAGASASTVHPGGTSPITLGVPLPAGIKSGDLLLIFMAIRDLLGRPQIPGGWNAMGPAGTNIHLASKICTGLETSPITVTFNAGGALAAGSDASAQMAAFRGVSWECLAKAYQTGTNQNVFVPGMEWGPETRKLLVINAGWKQNAWTSVSSSYGGTVIGSFTATAGNDQSMMWEYYIEPNLSPPISAGGGAMFTVTGGVSAPYAGQEYVWVPRIQLMTVQRAVNGVSKTHFVNTPIRFTRPATLAL